MSKKEHMTGEKELQITYSFCVPDNLFVSSDTLKKAIYDDIERYIIYSMGKIGVLKYTSGVKVSGNVVLCYEDVIRNDELCVLEYRPELLNQERTDTLLQYNTTQ